MIEASTNTKAAFRARPNRESRRHSMANQENKERKLGLSGEDVLHKNEGPGIEKLFAAMGDSEADPAALAASEDGILVF